MLLTSFYLARKSINPQHAKELQFIKFNVLVDTLHTPSTVQLRHAAEYARKKLQITIKGQ